MRRLALLTLLAPTLVSADNSSRCVDVSFTPAANLQIVVWIEDSAGNFKDTLFITQQTGSFGLGNRPGRFDFNSGPLWPYGRRVTTFPVWSHRNGQTFPSILFQNDTNEDPTYCQSLASTDQNYPNCGDNQLSHAFGSSSAEKHYCRPLSMSEDSQMWDAMTCATSAFSDKGRFSTDPSMTTGYPPRIDVIPLIGNMLPDSPSVAMYASLNPYDAISQPTPIGGTAAHAPWPVPDSYPAGDYVLFVEASLEQDFNATYDPTSYPPPPDIAYGEYGVPYRGQPSIIYSVPITIGASATSGETMTFAGYGDPTGADGVIRPPDSTITTDTPGTGASRLQLVADGSDMYRVKVDVAQNTAADLPAAPDQLQATAESSSDLTMSFVAPGIGIQQLKVSGYEVRVRANDEMTADNFEDSMMVTATVTPDDPGHTQTFDISGLLPDTDYWVGIRAYDGCHNNGDVAIVEVTTADRTSGTVDACFVATAAYGSIMANDVEMLRHFRDSWLETNVIGELGVEAYYTFGPAIAGIVGESDLLRATARHALEPLVHAVKRSKF